MNPDPNTLLIDLLDQVARQDQQALHALYQQTSSKLYGLALKIVRNREWAEDVLQESFLYIWRSARMYRASLSPPMAWMGVIVRSRSLDHLRRQRAEGDVFAQDFSDELAQEVAADEPTPLDITQASQQAVALHQCLQQLAPEQQRALSLAYFNDLSHSQLAQQMNAPMGTVKTWIRRSLLRLRTCMARYA